MFWKHIVLIWSIYGYYCRCDLNIYLAGCCWFSTIYSWPVYCWYLRQVSFGWPSYDGRSYMFDGLGGDSSWDSGIPNHFIMWVKTSLPLMMTYNNILTVTSELRCNITGYNLSIARLYTRKWQYQAYSRKKKTKYLFFPDTFPIKQVILPLFTEKLPGVNVLYYEYIDLLVHLSKILWFLWSTKAVGRFSR